MSLIVIAAAAWLFKGAVKETRFKGQRSIKEESQMQGNFVYPCAYGPQA